MKVFTCRICGEVYIGGVIPNTCPFCGAANKYLVMSSVWKDENNIELSAVSRKNLETALQLELSNAAFYKCLAEKLENVEYKLMFKGLFKVEREHADVFKKLLKPEVDPQLEEICINDPVQAVQESLQRETKAIQFYGTAAQEAVEPRIKEIFFAVMEIEKDHLALDQEKLLKLKE